MRSILIWCLCVVDTWKMTAAEHAEDESSSCPVCEGHTLFNHEHQYHLSTPGGLYFRPIYPHPFFFIDHYLLLTSPFAFIFPLFYLFDPKHLHFSYLSSVLNFLPQFPSFLCSMFFIILGDGIGLGGGVDIVQNIRSCNKVCLDKLKMYGTQAMNPSYPFFPGHFECSNSEALLTHLRGKL